MWGSPLCRHPSQAVQGAPELLEDWLKEGGAEGQIIGGTWQRPGQSVAWPGVTVSRSDRVLFQSLSAALQLPGLHS